MLYDNELTHYGIKGQKWGIRRFQNEDGSLTPKGRSRRNKSTNNENIKESTITNNMPDFSDVKGRVANGKQFTAALLTIGGGYLVSTALAKKKLITKGQALQLGTATLTLGFLLGAKAVHSDTYSNELTHYGIKGQKWGIRRYENEDGSLTPAGKARYAKLDQKWIDKKGDKIYQKARKQSAKEINKFVKKDMKSMKFDSATAVNMYNKKLAEIMRSKTSDLRTPSGKVIEWVAKRGEYGVYMAVADAGYDMQQLKNGVWSNGRVGYKQSTVDMKNY